MGNVTVSPAGDKAVVVVATSEDAGTAVAQALTLLGVDSPLGGNPLVLMPSPPAPKDLRGAVGVLTASGAELVRPSGLGIAGCRWTSIPTVSAARRFDTVQVPTRLMGRQRVIFMPLPNGRKSPTPIGFLSRFADSRQRLAATLSGDRGAVAELAAPLQPSLVALVGGIDGQSTVVLSADLVAVELVARAWMSDGADGPGAWEHPVVQRAIDVGLGVDGPHRLRLLSVGLDGAKIVKRMAPRLGIDSPDRRFRATD
jgi:hypothetical protein